MFGANRGESPGGRWSSVCKRERDELFAQILLFDTLGPRIGFVLERVEQARVKRLAALCVFQNLLLDVLHADTIDVMHRAFEVVALFAIKLKEGAAVFLDIFLSLDLAQELGDLGLDAGVARDVDFVA